MNDPGGGSPAPARRRSMPPLRAIVLRRSDFRESTRIVTCLTREHGRIAGLAKGAHRLDSPFLGRLDFLVELRATFSADRGGLRLLERAELVRERRALREPVRFLAASHLARLCDFAAPDDRPEPEVFDLLHGGLNLIERCPPAAIGRVVLGLELRVLGLLGALPDLHQCGACGTALGDHVFRHQSAPGLLCRACAEPPFHAESSEGIGLLRRLQATTGRQWPQWGDAPPARLAANLPALWLASATEQRSGLRGLLFERCLDSSREG